MLQYVTLGSHEYQHGSNKSEQGVTIKLLGDSGVSVVTCQRGRPYFPGENFLPPVRKGLTYYSEAEGYSRNLCEATSIGVYEHFNLGAGDISARNMLSCPKD